jgi:hypothetical protein
MLCIKVAKSHGIKGPVKKLCPDLAPFMEKLEKLSPKATLPSVQYNTSSRDPNGILRMPSRAQSYFPRDILAALDAAISALKARGLESPEFRRVAAFQCELAISNLNHALIHTQYNADHIVVSNLVAWLAYSSVMEELEATYYFSLAYTLVCEYLGSLDRGSRFITGTSLQADFWMDAEHYRYIPFVLDCANAWLTRTGVIPPRMTTFDQRVKYFDEFISSGDSGPWYSSLLEAANSTLGNLMEVALSWTYRFAKAQITGALDRGQLEQVLLYIRSELGDTNLHAALQTLYRSFQGPNTKHTTVEGQLITRLFHRLRSVLFLHAVLSAPSISEGFRHPDANLIAKKIVYFCNKQVIRRDGPIEDYFLLSWHNFSYLMLGGTGLRSGDCPPSGKAP